VLTTTTFVDRLRAAQTRNASLLCVGLDPDPRRFPRRFGNDSRAIAAFNRAIVEATADLVCCYKPNLGFYVAYGSDGIDALAQLRDDVPADIPILLDAKVGDMDMTTAAYARGFFGIWNVDAVTANPFMGHDSLLPLLERPGRGVFVLCKTSNPDSGAFQDRPIAGDDGVARESLSLTVARQARRWNEQHENVGLVVGATYPAQMATIRAAAPDLPILVPGVGAQAGDLEGAVRAGLDEHRAGLIVSSSRAICYASAGDDFQEAARAAAVGFRDAIEQVRHEA
jgi:orotidine-5'-phosphate decarboxylase